MVHSELLFQTPPWFLVLCILAGAAYALLLYRPVGPWGARWNWFLAGVRGFLIAFIVFLLLNPLVRNTTTLTEKAKIVLAIDNSASMAPYAQEVRALAKSLSSQLEEKDFDVSWQSLNENNVNLDSLQFDFPETDLSTLLATVKRQYEGQHLTDLVLISDGIVNRGLSPIYKPMPFRVNTLALGDTTPVADLRVSEVVHNKVAYLGNKFPIKVELVGQGLEGKRATVLLKHGGKVLESRSVGIDRKEYYQELTFEVTSTEKGVQRYTVSVVPVSGEYSKENNDKDVYIDIIDGRQRILLLGAVPHPDLKALKAILESDDNYEVVSQVLSVNATLPKSAKPYDLVILHQIPNNMNIGNQLISNFRETNTPLLFVLGNQSSTSAFNTLNQALQIVENGNQKDLVRGKYNTSFHLLNLDEKELDVLGKLPPLSVPFGDYQIRTGAEAILYQQVGSVPTTKPLLLVRMADGNKTGVLTGEGLWAWRQEEFLLTGQQEVVDKLFKKLVQLLSVKEDKRKFRVYPVKNEYLEGETVDFRTEVYNQVYESVYGNDIKLELADGQHSPKSYNYRVSKEMPKYQISALDNGVYRFKASANIDGANEEVTGQFIIKKQDLEQGSTTADFGLLREVAQNNGGTFLEKEGIASFVENLQANRPADRLDVAERLQGIIHYWWIALLIILLMTMEWGLRKYLGAY
ncbi:hypothetical protein CLV98_10444 [Dyadobacter jejuensis]|uniref:VWA domain-containing protein n=1 Tax=Dyadobacter jejuensis TaxID=1082580 RepID=A0A316B6M1_9BACT|nr:hypothetical protein [Dyadobacter jejuensis]PWJ58187.1 hypothetical protein CLV98_10444 [Dyadobacter jejuensis]